MKLYKVTTIYTDECGEEYSSDAYLVSENEEKVRDYLFKNDWRHKETFFHEGKTISFDEYLLINKGDSKYEYESWSHRDGLMERTEWEELPSSESDIESFLRLNQAKQI